MTEALARIRNDAVLSRPGKKSAPRGPGLLRRTVDLAAALSPRFVVGAILSALLVGIGVNALVLQRERHPAPLFAPPPPQRVAAPVPVASPPPPPPSAPAAREPPAAAPPSPPPAARSAAPAARAPDAIGDLLRGEPPADNSRLVKEAQTALAKLGHALKANGVQGPATDQALREFERAHGLPLSTEITPRLVKQLSAAARAAAH
ncbi:putative peptidoglycan binding protein [Roseiarcus fermentans]|uniref:Putative peptidoglycan binding protein n=1 Tax=Roseiarcus fermentans TaxID=1473586 RepID=A0A366FNU3_9HYPH|nr:peptidoglycan-binding domain-containing protein [Roseiarcus fermentans]RBP16363.1 putative peptidoglycan binding protein [Roseiarcus fermentans]